MLYDNKGIVQQIPCCNNILRQLVYILSLCKLPFNGQVSQVIYNNYLRDILIIRFIPYYSFLFLRIPEDIMPVCQSSLLYSLIDTCILKRPLV